MEKILYETIAHRHAGWSDAEDNLLFTEAKSAHEVGRPMSYVFRKVSAITGRKPNSIRNYYYKRAKDDDVACTVGASNAFIPFSDEETHNMLREILIKQAQGVSVRACTIQMGAGDTAKTLRYQNKYRALIRNSPELVKRVVDELRAEGHTVCDPCTMHENKKRTVVDNTTEQLLRELVGQICAMDDERAKDCLANINHLIRIAAG